MDAMNVLYFSQHFSTPAGSSGSRPYQMARHLIARGHQVTIVCGSYSGGTTGLTSEFKHRMRRGEVDGFSVIEFDLAYSNKDSLVKRALTFLRFAWRSVCLVFTEQYDLLFATTTPLTAGIPGVFARWLRKKPFVFEVRDLWPELPKAMGVVKNPLVLFCMSMLERASYYSANRLIGLSPGIVDGIKRCGIPSERITMVSNGCDLDLFNHQITPWRPETVKETDFLAVYAGTHGIANGLSSLLDAACELKRRGRHDIKLLLVGEGRLKPELEARAKTEGLSDIIFHPPLDKNSLAGLMADSDLGLQLLANIPAFYYGTSPNKFFDYIASGLPVLVNYPGWIADMVEKQACGFVIPPQNPIAFADALELAANEQKKLKVMGQHSAYLAEYEFNRSKLAEHFVDWLEGCLTPLSQSIVDHA